MQNNTSFKIALRMDSAPPRVRSRIFSAVLLAALVAGGCGDGGEDPTGVPPGTATNPALNPGLTGGLGGAVPPGTVPPGSVTPTPTPVLDAGVGTTPTKPTTGGGSTDTPWCKVKAILDKNCSTCHKNPPEFAAPFPLQTIADLTKASPTKAGKKIYERIGVRINATKVQAEGTTLMPPGNQLAAADIATIDSWIAAGAPPGDNPTCTPPAGTVVPDAGAPQADITWPLPECDKVYKITAAGTSGNPMSVAPGQEVHPQVSVPAPWGSEKVQAIAFKTITDNKKVLHHWILNGGGAFLTGWAPGEDGIKLMAPDVGMDMPSGSLRLDMHYNSLQATTTEKDSSGVEVCVVGQAKFRKNHAAVTMGLSSLFNLSVPPGAKNHEVKSSMTVSGSTPITLLSASPHAHKLAVRMLFTVKKKNGTLITMHDMPFMFGEQHSYKLDPPVVVEAGDVINTSCFYTNPGNTTVTFGENTGNEMCFNFALYYPAGALGGGAAGGIDIGSLFGGGP
jgi:Copper type II ascorbate-dependent monooxygenase, C-terminal domain